MLQTAPKQRKGTTIVSVYLLFRKGDEICLLLRRNTGYNDGRYGLIAGHVEDGEPATAAMIREAHEEAGLILTPDSIQVAHIMHRKTSQDRLGIEIFFECKSWSGQLENKEPHKCEELRFFPLDNLPQNAIFYVVEAIQAVSRGQFYSERGW